MPYRLLKTPLGGIVEHLSKHYVGLSFTRLHTIGLRTVASITMTLRTAVFYRNLGLVILFVCGIAVGLRSGDSLRYLDERDYEQLARSLLHNQTFAFADGNPTAWRPPGYPAFIAVAYVIAERPLAAKVENVCILIFAALALGIAANRIHPNAGAITPFLVLGYPLLIYAASVLYPQVLGCLLLTIIVLLLSAEELSKRSAAFAGLVTGILILAIPFFILILPVLAAFVLFRRDLQYLVRLRATILFVAAAALVVTAWTVRNYLYFHTIIPVSTNGGWNLFIGNSPGTTPNGSVAAVDVISVCKRVRPDMGVIELDRAVGKCAMDWIIEDPWAAGKLYVRKVINYFNFRNELATKNEATPWRDWLIFATYYPLLLIAIVRAALFRRCPFGKTEALIYVIYFSNAFISAIYFTRIRFRIPFDFLLIAVAAGFLGRYWNARHVRNSFASLEKCVT
jgi:hypothetical protein